MMTYRIKETFYVDEDTSHVQYVSGFEKGVEFTEDAGKAYLFTASENARQVVDVLEDTNWRNRDSGATYEIESV